jgi:hypothetical protein
VVILVAERSAKGLPSHPPLRAARQRQLQGQHCACQRADRRPSVARRSAAGARRRRSARRDRSSPAVPVLRRPHDHCRNLCARRHTAWPTILRCGDQDVMQ